jgi:hypothetical protein
MTVGVFISYNHADFRVANALKQCLNALSGDLSVFIDHAGLIAGDEYEPTLARNIAASQWFLLICSGPQRPERDMGWCLVEAGQFRAKLLNEKQENLLRSRLITVHDDERPRQVAQYQSVKISTVDKASRPLDLKQGSEDLSNFEFTDAFELFRNIIEHSGERPLRDLRDTDTRDLLRDQARRLIRAFWEAQSGVRLPEVVLQRRISFHLPPLGDRDTAILSDDVAVTGYDSSLTDIFGIAGTTTTWGNIRLRVKEGDGTDPLWVTDVYEAARDVSRDYVPEQPDGLCLSVADGKFYRVLFARYEPYRNGARTCYILFVPSRPRQFELQKRSSILLSALILSIRFRQRILPFIETIQSAPRSKTIETLFTLERVLHQVETEAVEFGLRMAADEDEAPLMQVVRPGDGKRFMEDSVKSWTAERAALAAAISAVRNAGSDTSRSEAAVQAASVACEALNSVRLVNGKFIQVLTEELLFIERVGLDEARMPPP